MNKSKTKDLLVSLVNIKNNTSMKKIIILTTLLLSTQLLAQPRNGGFASFSLGPGFTLSNNIRLQNSYEKADGSTNSQVIPMAMIRIGPVRIMGPNVTVGLFRTPLFAPYLKIGREGDRYYGPDELDWRVPSWFVGGGFDTWKLNFEFLKGIQGRSKGKLISATFKDRLQFGKFGVGYKIGLKHYDSNFNNYYYGVKEHEVTANRGVYTPGSSLSYILGVTPTYSFNDKLNYMFSFTMEQLGSKIDNSPTTDGSLKWNIFTGLSYMF